MFRVRMQFVAMVCASLVVLGALLIPIGVSAQGNSENTKLCQSGGYLNYTDADGNGFKNAGQCVRFAAQGNDLVPVAIPTAHLSFHPSGSIGGCAARLSVNNYTPGSYTVMFSGHTGIPFPLTVGPDGAGTVASDELSGTPFPGGGLYASYLYTPSNFSVTASINATVVATGTPCE